MRSIPGTIRLLLPALLLTLGACMSAQARPAQLDMSRSRVMTQGLYRAEIRPDGDSIPQRKLHRWYLTVTTADGAPVDSAAITVDGGMPQHGHGLPSVPKVTRPLGDGRHLVEGMKFNMRGWWVLKVRVAARAGTDSVTFNLDL